MLTDYIRPTPNTTPSAGSSSSCSVLPVPPLSSARFLTTAITDNVTTSTQLTVYPHSGQLDSTDSVIIARFLQSCGILGEEMRALRAEVAQLPAERDVPVFQLEERVRGLAERAPLSSHPHRPNDGHRRCITLERWDEDADEI
ncbi:hypothetical protein C8J57DRAFT_1229618 [Mycena rebaudengoi]|nr:hypothetical protein C8J57DRAFT_1229618 [Mycena rebaudengoi]